MSKQLPIGIDDFKKIITQNYYYIDKSLFIKEVLDSGAAGTLIPARADSAKHSTCQCSDIFLRKQTNQPVTFFDGLAITKT